MSGIGRRATGAGTLALALLWLVWPHLETWRTNEPWSVSELALIDSLWIGHLPAPPPDPTNHVADDPRAAAFGHRLFFDTRLSANSAVSCATCHRPERYFTDGLPVSVGIGQVTKNAMTVVGAAWSPWLFWDGRKDSLWSQAAAPLEDPLEQGSHRLEVFRVISSDSEYRREYEALFGPLPDGPGLELALAGEGGSPDGFWNRLSAADRTAVTGVLTNTGKALEAYQRLLIPGPSRFDEYAAGLRDGAGRNVLDPEERRGLRIFIGRGQCIDCHNGPLFTNHAFHNTGSLSAPGQLPSRGRIRGAAAVREDPFNCLGDYSDDRSSCAELEFLKAGDALLGAHRTPSLRNVSKTAPYLHAGQLATLDEVVAQYDLAAGSMIGHNDAKPLDLSRRDRADLVSFLKTLDGPIAADARWLRPPEDR